MPKLGPCNIHARPHRNRSLLVRDGYIPFSSTAKALVTGNPIDIVGFGTVELPTKRFARGQTQHATIKLTNVLHVPGYWCNVISMRLEEDYDVRLTSFAVKGASGSVRDRQGRQLAYFKPRSENHGFWQLRLSGPPVGPKVGPNVLIEGLVIAGLGWAQTERERMAKVRASRSKEVEMVPGMAGLMINPSTGVKEDKAPEIYFLDCITDGGKHPGDDACTNKEHATTERYFTNDEKHWIRKSYGGLGPFVRCYRLKQDEWCYWAKAKTLIRALRAIEDDDDDDDDDEGAYWVHRRDLFALLAHDTDPEPTPISKPKPETKPESTSKPEPPLTRSEKAWLKGRYSGEYKFLSIHGYSIYDEDDREVGRALLREMMKHYK